MSPIVNPYGLSSAPRSWASMPSDSSRAASTRARNAPATQVSGAIGTRPSMKTMLRPPPLACGGMPAVPRTGVAVAVVVGAAFVPTAAGAATAGAPPVPLNQWVATFCQTFGTYETDALAAQAKLHAALGGATDSGAGATATAAVADALGEAGRSARAAATAATAAGVPDVPKGRALTRELQSVLRKAADTYEREAQRASTLPVEPKALTKAAKKISSDLVKGLDAHGKHAKRLRKLDVANTMGGAIAADPTCAAAARRGGSNP